ncbi:MAG: type VI secretion system ATPase TssH, partial [Chitinivibrionales bacterium]|nr:type VI secretion system ATPase TssH [Chitinivibrionales bacterium]
DMGVHAMTSCAGTLSAIDREALRAELPSLIRSTPEHDDQTQAQTPADKADNGPLGRFCRNLTQLARDGAMDPVLGRGTEIRQALDILARRRKNNPILVGEAGVGKTAVVEGIAQRVADGDVPEGMRDVDIWELDLGLLQAGASVRGEFEKRLKGVVDAVKSSPSPAILFIDEAHTLIGAGGPSGGSDAANLLKPVLARGEMRTIAATTWSEYRKYFEKDPALSRRFHQVAIDEPDEERCCVMLRGVARRFAAHHGVHIADEAIRSAVSLSHRYIAGRQLPDKAVDLLDTAAGRVHMSRSVRPPCLDSSERDLQALRMELESLEHDQAGGITVDEDVLEDRRRRIAEGQERLETLGQQWERERSLAEQAYEARAELHRTRDSGGETGALREDVVAASAALDEARGAEPMVFTEVTADVCAQVVADWTGIPAASMLKDEAQVLLEIERRLGERVIGQDWALSDLADALRASRAGLRRPDTPLGVFLFAGPSGVGKTECAHALAELMFGGEEFLTVINMSEYQEKHTVSQLKGSPPGYVGYGEGGVLTEAVRRRPYSLVLLDEVEKAHIEVMNLFYQVFDKGFMRDGEGRRIDFRNTVVIMTSNLGADTIMDLHAGGATPDADALVDAVRPELSAHFKPALLGRCRIVPFRPLGPDVLRQVVAGKLARVTDRAAGAHGAEVLIDEGVVEALTSRCTTEEAGARIADTVIEQTVVPALSREILAWLGERENECLRVRVGVKEGAVTVRRHTDPAYRKQI